MRIWQWILGLLISALALYGAIRGLDLPTLWAALQAGNYGWGLPALLALTLSVAARTARWRLLLNRPPGVSFYRLWNILNVGYLVTHLLPFRMGELARVLLLARYPQTPPGLVAMSIVVEHILDLVAVLMLAGLALALRPEALGIRILSGVGLGLTVGALLMLWIGAFRPNWAWRLAEGLTQPFPARFRERMRQEARAALSGLEVLRTPRALAEALGWSLAAWVAAGAQLYAIMGAFLPDLDWLPALWTMTALTFGMLVPSTPGYIGVVQGITVWVLGHFGIPQATAFSISVVSHALIYFYLSALGALGLWMETGSFRLRFLQWGNTPHSQ
ncbi:lysylphosphatidylglycerol synthase transmembrane domain-containing protein [Thermoflexus sp.]|uniref:lysylphosphatidylglycerol synthase transmembrane domain-containing protein n=1 Tax=Thermoflexus sp. TaxID=1969742 RepID=UPI0035E4343B